MDVFLQSVDNIKIYVNESVVLGQKAVILIHGLAEHSGRYTDFIADLNKNNISVFAIDLRGHGKSQKRSGDVESLKKLQNDIQTVYDYIKNKYQYKTIGLFGHSVGGGLSLIYAAQSDIDFLILSSPLVYTPKKLRPLKFFPFKLFPHIKIKKKFSESPEMLNKSYADPLATNKISLRTVGVLLFSMPKVLVKRLNGITCPVLFMYGKQDVLLNEEDKFKDVFDAIGSKNKSLVVYKDAKHRIVHNEGSESRVKDIIDWINKI